MAAVFSLGSVYGCVINGFISRSVRRYKIIL